MTVARRRNRRRNHLFLLSCLLLEEEEEGSSSGNFTKNLRSQSRRLRQGKIRRGALTHPNESSFAVLFASGHDDALVTLCGFDHESFNKLHLKFQPFFDDYSPYRQRGRRIEKHNKNLGRQRIITSIQCHALVLSWNRTRGSNAVLQLIFGMTAPHI